MAEERVHAATSTSGLAAEMAALVLRAAAEAEPHVPSAAASATASDAVALAGPTEPAAEARGAVEEEPIDEAAAMPQEPLTPRAMEAYLERHHVRKVFEVRGHTTTTPCHDTSTPCHLSHRTITQHRGTFLLRSALSLSAIARAPLQGLVEDLYRTMPDDPLAQMIQTLQEEAAGPVLGAPS